MVTKNGDTLEEPDGVKYFLFTANEYKQTKDRIEELKKACNDACELGKKGISEEIKRHKEEIKATKKEYEDVIQFAGILGLIIGFLIAYAIFK